MTTKRRINEGGHSQNLKRRKVSNGSLLEIEKMNSSSASASHSLRAVSLRADGTFMEVLLPLTKKLSKRATILGNWDFIEVILVVLDDQDDEDISFNTHILLPPFQNTKFRGDILLIKRDVEGSPVDYSITSYKDFLQLESAEFPCEFHDAKYSEDDDRQDGGDKKDLDLVSQNSTASAEQEFYKYMLGEKFQKFRADNQRDLRKEEILKLLCSCY